MQLEPKWKSLIVESEDPVFTPEHCLDIIGQVDYKKKKPLS